ncbi:DUF459 domain-containing protein [Lacibacterium aquatile]|uniref:DUF459 domain-containing protein n=1 Tax=Lacibacterium aquatile TaxID=1168082 RepID=A0ABW5DVD2_9PROT
MLLFSRRNLVLLIAGLFIASAPPAFASGDGDAVPGDTKQTTVLVFGDSMADGLWGGLTRALVRDNSIKLLRRGKNGTGLARPDVYDWPAALPQMLEQEPPSVAIVSFGLNDRQDSFFEGRRQHYYKTDAWKQTYIERIEAILKPLADKKIKTIWVGLPIMRDPKVSKDAEYLNALYADVVAKHGATFFPLWELSVDENHEYTSHGRGSDGRLRPFRNDDGMHFTMGGYDILARELLKTISVQQLARVGN